MDEVSLVKVSRTLCFLLTFAHHNYDPQFVHLQQQQNTSAPKMCTVLHCPLSLSLFNVPINLLLVLIFTLVTKKGSTCDFVFSVYHYFDLGLLFLWEWMNSIYLQFCKVDCGGVVSTYYVLCKGSTMILRHYALYKRMHTIYLSIRSICLFIYLSIYLSIYLPYIYQINTYMTKIWSQNTWYKQIYCTHTPQKHIPNNKTMYSGIFHTHTPHIYLLPTNLLVENLEICLLTK